MSWCRKYQSSFNGYPIRLPGFISRPESYAALRPIQSMSIARGSGASYGDAALNQHGEIILTERLDRFLAFDEQQGIISAEAGITLAKILEVIVPRGWFLPVTPGTAETSLGGCIAADIHGKNHLQAGSLGQYVRALELITAEGQPIQCSPEILPELFWATLGGMGLTGIVGTVTLQLKRIETAYMQVQHQATENLEQTVDCLSREDVVHEYQVAWLDTLNNPLGRGVIIKARHADLVELPGAKQSHAFSVPSHQPFTFPFYLPNGFLYPTFIKLFNQAYYHRLASKTQPFLLAYRDYFYPLDRINGWSRLYGKRGFIQYQCALPMQSAYAVIKQILETLATRGYPVYLAVLKRFDQASLAPLSFPLAGLTLALDMPIPNQGLFSCLDELDHKLIDVGGRVYLAKDARLKPEAFRAMYPRYSEWLAIKRHWDPENRWSSSLSRRLAIGS